MLTKIEIPNDYVPKVYIYNRREKPEVWRWKYLLPDGTSWFHCTAGNNEKRAARDARTKESELAKGLLTDKEIAKMQKGSCHGLMTLENAVNRYLEISGLEKTGETLKGEAPMLRASFRFLYEEFNLSEISKVKSQHIDEFRDHLLKRVAGKELVSISANNRLKGVKKVFKWLKKRKILLSNPAVEIDPIRVTASDKARSVTFTEYEIERLLAAPYKCRSGFDVKSFFLLIYTTGLRSGEALHLEWSDIDLENREIHLRSKPKCPTQYGLGWKPKCKKERPVYLNDAAVYLLQRLPHRRSVGYFKCDSTPYPAEFVFVTKDHLQSKTGEPTWRRMNDVRTTWSALLKSAGLWSEEREEMLTVHDTRRTWNAQAKAKGGTTGTERSSVLGHSETVNELHYSGKAQEGQLRGVMQRHPSNNLRFVELACSAGVPNTNNDQKIGGDSKLKNSKPLETKE